MKCIYKQYFDNLDVAKELWNNQKQKLVYKIIEFISNPKNIIRRLYNQNDMELTEAVKSNLKIGKISINEINNNFKFQQHEATGKNEINLAKKMINAFFGIVVSFSKNKETNAYERVSIHSKEYIKIETDKKFLENVKKITEALKEHLFVKERVTNNFDEDEY